MRVCFTLLAGCCVLCPAGGGEGEVGLGETLPQFWRALLATIRGSPTGSMLRDLPLLDLPQPQESVEKVA